MERVEVDGSTAASLTALLDRPALEDLSRTLSISLNDITRNDQSKSMIRFILGRMEAACATRGFDYVTKVSSNLLALPGLKSVAMGDVYYELLACTAQCALSQGVYPAALAADTAVQEIPPNMRECMLPEARLRSVIRLLEASERLLDDEAAELARTRGVQLYRSMSVNIAPGITGLILHYLNAVGASLRRRRMFAEAARAFGDRYQSTHSLEDLEKTVVCTLLSAAGPARTSNLAKQCLSAEVRCLGDLWDVLRRASKSQILLHDDVRIISERSPTVPRTTVESSIHEHNIYAMSIVYENINLDALQTVLGGMPENEVVQLVAAMVMEGRLKAKIDQQTGWVFFETREEATTLSEWDGRIGFACNALSHAANLICATYPDLSDNLEVNPSR